MYRNDHSSEGFSALSNLLSEKIGYADEEPTKETGL